MHAQHTHDYGVGSQEPQLGPYFLSRGSAPPPSPLTGSCRCAKKLTLPIDWGSECFAPLPLSSPPHSQWVAGVLVPAATDALHSTQICLQTPANCCCTKKMQLGFSEGNQNATRFYDHKFHQNCLMVFKKETKMQLEWTFHFAPKCNHNATRF